MKKTLKTVLVLMLCLVILSACTPEPTPPASDGAETTAPTETVAYYFAGNGLLAVTRGEGNRLLSLGVLGSMMFADACHGSAVRAIRIIYSDTGAPASVGLLDREETVENEKLVSLVPSEDGSCLVGHVSLDRWDGHIRIFCGEDGSITRIEDDKVLRCSVSFLADGRVGAVDDAAFTYEEGAISFTYSDDVPTRVTYNEKGLPVEWTMSWRSGTSSTLWTYDDQGRAVSYESRADGKLRSSAVYEYGENGRIAKCNTFVYSLEEYKHALAEIHYAHDADGRLTEYRYYLFRDGGKELLDSISFAYDERTGAICRYTHLEPREERKTVTEYAYDGSIECLTEAVYSSDGTLTQTYVTRNTYDTQGHLLERTATLTDPDGKTTSESKYSYLYGTAQTRLEEKEEWWRYDTDGVIDVYTLNRRNYGENGKMIKKIEARFTADDSETGTYGSVYEYEYGETGREHTVFETAYRADGTVKRTTLTKYNEHGLEISKENVFYPEAGE